MTKEEHIEFLINRIEEDLKLLQTLTEKDHISTFVIGDFYYFSAHKDGDENDKPIEIYKSGDEEI